MCNSYFLDFYGKEVVILYHNFEKIINEKGITPYRVSKDTEIPYSTLSDWKMGKSKPKLDKLIKISAYLGVTLNELIDDSEKREKDVRTA
jgi:predicted transcriptional regulator